MKDGVSIFVWSWFGVGRYNAGYNAAKELVRRGVLELVDEAKHLTWSWIAVRENNNYGK